MSTASDPGSPDRSSFVNALFDFDFRSFIGLRLIKVVYLVGTVLLGLAALVGFFTWTARGATGFLVGVFFVALMFLYLLVLRVSLEVTSLLYRISENVAALAAGAQPAAPMATAPLTPAEQSLAEHFPAEPPFPETGHAAPLIPAEPLPVAVGVPAPAAAPSSSGAASRRASRTASGGASSDGSDEGVPASRRQGPALIPVSAFTEGRGQRDGYAAQQEEYAAQQAQQAQYAQQADYGRQAEYGQPYGDQERYGDQEQYAQDPYAQYAAQHAQQAQQAQQAQYAEYAQQAQYTDYPPQAQYVTQHEQYPAQNDYPTQVAYPAQPDYPAADYAQYPAQGAQAGYPDGGTQYGSGELPRRRHAEQSGSADEGDVRGSGAY